jgi:hypothetical protein
MLHEENVVNGEFQGVFLQERAYEEEYNTDSKALKRSLIEGAKKFLEEQ